MVYSIIHIGGFQYNVRLGQSLKVPKINAEVGQEVNISDVLMANNGSETNIGTPFLSDSSVSLEILAHGKYDKIIVFKHKRRKGYRRTQGHRQIFTEVIVKSIKNGSNKENIEESILVRHRARVKTLTNQKLPAVKQSKQKIALQETVA